MVRSKLTMIMVLVLSLGLVSGCLVSKKVGLCPGVKEKVAEVNARLMILVDEEGNFVVTDNKGNQLTSCTIEPSNTKTNTQCKGLRKGYGVEKLNSITIIKSKGSPFCYTVYDMEGAAEEYCWEW